LCGITTPVRLTGPTERFQSNPMPIHLKILANEETPLGILSLRERLTLSEPHTLVTEVTLNHEFLMSSLHTDSERTLATLALERVDGDNLQVLIGGLGLGYTVAAALESSRVGHVEVIEFLPVTYTNQHVGESFTDWLFVGQVAS